MIKAALSRVLWPGLLGACIALNHVGLGSASPILIFNLIYFSLALTLLMLERVMPYESAWLENDGQIGPDLSHTLLNKGVVQLVATAVVAMGIAEAVDAEASMLWPDQSPLAVQIILGLIVAEAGLYLAHRLAHFWPRLWCFHAVHHSVTRLWIINTGRFHFVDTIVSISLSQPLLYLAGAPKLVFLWVAAITAFVGVLTHCNVEMKNPWLRWVFNTPELHRWHHSKVPSEGNTNFGENLMLYDQIFSTYFFPARRPPKDIGINTPMPAGFLGQLRAPFTWVSKGLSVNT
jgi:sterol desaturase/sphingolipid hydroxylase (fatty acid hydroxylase superfamily)